MAERAAHDFGRLWHLAPLPGLPIDFVLPERLNGGSHIGDAATPLCVLVDSAGRNVEDLAAASVLAVTDAGSFTRLLIADDRRDPGTAETVAEAAARRGAHCVIGHFGSRTSRPASRIYARHGIPFLAPGSSADDLCSPEAHTTRQLFGLDREQLDCLVERAPRSGRVLILGQTANYGEGLALRLRDRINHEFPDCESNLIITDNHSVHQKLDVLAHPKKYLLTFILGSQEFAQNILNSDMIRHSDTDIILSDDAFRARIFPSLDVAQRSYIAFLDNHHAALLDSPAPELRRRAGLLLRRPPNAFFETSYVAMRAFIAAWTAGRHQPQELLTHIDRQAWETPFGRLAFDGNGRLTGHRWRASRPDPGLVVDPGHDDESNK
jgi:hypothetical protein